MASANVKRWVVLPPEHDKIIQEMAQKEGRSIANMLRQLLISSITPHE